MAKRSSAVPDSFEVDVVSLLRGQVDAIVHELESQSLTSSRDSRKRRPRTTSTASWKTSFPSCGSRARGCVSNISAS
jgi:hypothetical protein